MNLLRANITNQNTIFERITAFFGKFFDLPTTFAFFPTTMPKEGLMTNVAVTIPASGIVALANPSSVDSPLVKRLHTDPPSEWQLNRSFDDWRYYYDGKYTGIKILEITWIPIIKFPHRINLKHPIYRILVPQMESGLVELSSIKRAKRVAEYYYKTLLAVNSNGTVSDQFNLRDCHAVLHCEKLAQ